MVRYHVFLNLALPPLVTLQTCRLWNIEDEQAGQVAMPACQLMQAVTSFRLESCTICHREAPIVHAFIDDVIKKIERVTIDVLVGDVVADKLTTMIGRYNSGCPKALGCEGAFTATSRSA